MTESTTTTFLTLWSRSAYPGSTLPWVIERTLGACYVESLGVPVDGSEVELEGRIWCALPREATPAFGK